MGLLLSKEEQFDFEAELKKQTDLQSVVVGGEGEEEKGLGPIRRNIRFKDALVEVPWAAEDEKEQPADTLWRCFERGVRVNPDGNAQGIRPAEGDGFGAYKWTSYADVRTEALEVGAGLRALGLKRHATVGICSVNRPEWTTSALGLYSQGLVTVALYDTFGQEALEFIIDHAETEVVMSSVAKLPLILSCAEKAKAMKTVVVFDYQERYNNESERVTEEMVADAKAKGIELVTYSDLRAKGREAGAEADEATTEDLAFIMYTSGTTGMPKGVMLTHKNITACIAGFVTTIVTLEKSDVHFSYLPLAHIFETAVQGAIWGSGASIGFYSGHIKRLTADLGELHPTVFPGVPRVFQKIYDKLMDTVSKGGGIGKFLFGKALAQDAAKVRRGQKLDMNGFSQGKVFSKIRGKLGLDKCRVVVTGAAPCPPYIMEFLRVVVAPSAGVVQGYGMTETAAALTTSANEDHTLGHVGPPLASAEIRLRDVAEMGYTTANNCGEVIARGPSIFKGYWKNDEATNSTLEDGWIGTGDIGRWNANGTLSIIDRKKNIFKLAQGEYIASEKVEGVYARLPSVNQIWVYGNSYKSKIVAVVVPAWNHWDPIFRSKGWWGNGPEADEKNPERTDEYRAHFQKTVEENADAIKAAIKAEFKDVEDAAGLRGFEKLSGILLEGEIDVLGTGFNVDNDTLTPTFKLRRPFLLKRYLDRLRQLYTDLGEAPKDDEKW